jgi:hypothetical protein
MSGIRDREQVHEENALADRPLDNKDNPKTWTTTDPEFEKNKAHTYVEPATTTHTTVVPGKTTKHTTVVPGPTVVHDPNTHTTIVHDPPQTHTTVVPGPTVVVHDKDTKHKHKHGHKVKTTDRVDKHGKKITKHHENLIDDY